MILTHSVLYRVIIHVMHIIIISVKRDYTERIILYNVFCIVLYDILLQLFTVCKHIK